MTEGRLSDEAKAAIEENRDKLEEIANSDLPSAETAQAILDFCR